MEIARAQMNVISTCVSAVEYTVVLGECSAFLASGSDPTDDRCRHKV